MTQLDPTRLLLGTLGAVRRQVRLTLQLLGGLEPLVPHYSQEERLTSEMEAVNVPGASF